MDATEYRRRLEEDTPALRAWGELVISELNTAIRSKLGKSCFEDWVKIPPTYRVKSTDSFISKAFILNKGWFSCYEDIMDKVGVRFVLGLAHQIRLVSDIVLSVDIWNAIPSREFDEWKNTDPRLFDYQSAHYYLESLEDIQIDGVIIPTGTVCELQIRTLLQHAYAELSHDTLYKSNVTSQPEVHRLFAKSMALMETTDDMLAKAKEASLSAINFVRDWRDQIQCFAKKSCPEISFNFIDREDDFVIDSVSTLLQSIKFKEIEDFLSSSGNQFLSGKISTNQDSNPIFKTSAIFIIYFLAWRKPRALPQHTRIDRAALAKIYSDLGISPSWPSA
ncbi:RelA/SpoT domain-containing protein [Pseudomonas rhodesiae]|uniref:RelA/SpoT domain-containing protein n=1 Tax=Pseudomonas rhodesiae TaxID=76760 RepID=UPI001BCAED65|nr:RelA/SpoT domain-containing protein [Pseudomonas rhodesiae]QVN09516.1 RelA/SpoT domain-containing protein [Pseudomonas rhodesiae]